MNGPTRPRRPSRNMERMPASQECNVTLQSYRSRRGFFKRTDWLPNDFLAGFRPFAGLCAVALLVVFCSATNRLQAQTDDLPDIIFILSDDQAWNDYSFMGHPHIRTPEIDRLAHESQLFTRGYVPDSLCRPSLATIISGLYPHQHGIVGNDPPPSSKTAAGRMRAYGSAAYQRDLEEFLRLHIDRIQTLPDRCRQILTLRKIYGLPQKEIARQLGIAEHTVEAQVGAGVRRCAEYLSRFGLP